MCKHTLNDVYRSSISLKWESLKHWRIIDSFVQNRICTLKAYVFDWFSIKSKVDTQLLCLNSKSEQGKMFYLQHIYVCIFFLDPDF